MIMTQQQPTCDNTEWETLGGAGGQRRIYLVTAAPRTFDYDDLDIYLVSCWAVIRLIVRR